MNLKLRCNAPACDTGATITGGGLGRSETVVGVDEISVTFHRLPVETVGDRMESVLGGEFALTDRQLLGYRTMWVGPHGAKLLHDNDRGSYAGDVHAIFTGQACRSLSEAAMRRVFEFINENGGKCTRIDLALDDFLKRVSSQEFREHRNGPDVVTNTRKGKYRGDDETGGFTFYAGSRNSRMMMRVYDKDIESGGKIDAVRYELEAKDEAAVQLQRELVDGHWGDIWASHAVKLIDFRDRSVSSNVSRCPRVPWWESIVGDARRAAPYMAEKPKRVAEKMEMWKRQNGSMLAVFTELYGGVVVQSSIMGGRNRFKSKHHELIARGREEMVA